MRPRVRVGRKLLVASIGVAAVSYVHCGGDSDSGGGSKSDAGGDSASTGGTGGGGTGGASTGGSSTGGTGGAFPDDAVANLVPPDFDVVANLVAPDAGSD